MFKDLVDELKTFIKGESIFAFIPLGLYFLFKPILGYEMAFYTVSLISILILFLNIRQEKNWRYIASALAIVLMLFILENITGNTKGYFLQKIITNAFWLISVAVSLIIKKPLSIWLSHLSRNWEIKWYYHPNVFPAYYEVTFIWLFLMAIRLSLLVYFYLFSSESQLFILNTLLSTPATVSVLSMSFIYGRRRLTTLQGPSVKEFIEGKQAPWLGQSKGF